MNRRTLFTALLLLPIFIWAFSVDTGFNPVSAAVFGTVLTLIATAGIRFIWHGNLSFNVSEQLNVATLTQEKRKRETLDNVLRDLSDEQLDMLRQRLSDGTIDDDVLERRIVGTDGEYRYERT